MGKEGLVDSLVRVQNKSPKWTRESRESSINRMAIRLQFFFEELIKDLGYLWCPRFGTRYLFFSPLFSHS